MRYSIIVPVYNRPEEAAELLESLAAQTFKNFEVIIVEDGSTLPCNDVVERYRNALSIVYYAKSNTGRSDTRNVGMKLAMGDYLLFFDSDCILPPNYLTILNKELLNNYADCYGGPDKAQDSFTPTQKAINYAMTSLLTTGGIRGGKRHLKKFQPRTFNMGFSREVYERVGGFRVELTYSEDIDMSIRIAGAGFSIALFARAWVYHKRRVSFKKFYRQVRNFGSGRISLALLHKGSVKLVHAMPAILVLSGICVIPLSILCSPLFAALPALYLLALFLDAFARIRSMKTALLAVWAACVQILGYGIGFLTGFVQKILLKNGMDSRTTLQNIYQ
jgi:glycosyltransferase involved in cell wall biosynthesis